MTELAQAAAVYAGASWAVFPVAPRGKAPLTAHGLLDASCDPATVAAWWRRWPDANVGLSCGPSGVLVVDLDGADGMAAWADLAARNGGHPPTAQVATGRDGGGRHVYFTAAEPPRSRAIGRGVDTRGDGGYVVLPPSVHASGRRYRTLSCCRIADAPGWLLDLLAPPPPAPVGERRELPDGLDGATNYGRVALSGLVADMATAEPGTRNHTVNVLAYRAGRLVAAGELAESTVADELLAVALAVCADEPRKTLATFQRAFRDGTASPARRRER